MSMNRPAITEILKHGESYYSLVVAVAKRAREIVDQANEKCDIVGGKPVSLAVEEFAKGQCKMVESDEVTKLQ